MIVSPAAHASFKSDNYNNDLGLFKIFRIRFLLSYFSLKLVSRSLLDQKADSREFFFNLTHLGRGQNESCDPQGGNMSKLLNQCSGRILKIQVSKQVRKKRLDKWRHQ